MIGYYNYTVILTYIGTLSGFTGIVYIINSNSKAALICLLLSGFCDMFDGRIASTMKRTKQEQRFGIQIDSLSDLICFGVLPALIGIYYSTKNAFSLIIPAIYLLCALIRLAWFNVDEEERQEQEEGGRKDYLGLPVTSSALIIPLAIGFGQFCNLPIAFYLSWVLLAIAFAFIAPFHLKKPGRLGKLVMLLLGVTLLTMVMIRRSI